METWNVGTAVAVHEACHNGMPLVRRVVTVTGNPVENPTNFSPRIGTMVSKLVEQAGVLSGKTLARVISSHLDTVSIGRSDERFCVRRISPQLCTRDVNVLLERVSPSPPKLTRNSLTVQASGCASRPLARPKPQTRVSISFRSTSDAKLKTTRGSN